MLHDVVDDSGLHNNAAFVVEEHIVVALRLVSRPSDLSYRAQRPDNVGKVPLVDHLRVPCHGAKGCGVSKAFDGFASGSGEVLARRVRRDLDSSRHRSWMRNVSACAGVHRDLDDRGLAKSVELLACDFCLFHEQ